LSREPNRVELLLERAKNHPWISIIIIGGIVLIVAAQVFGAVEYLYTSSSRIFNRTFGYPAPPNTRQDARLESAAKTPPQVAMIPPNETKKSEPTVSESGKTYIDRTETPASVLRSVASLSIAELKERYIGKWIPAPGWLTELGSIPEQFSDHWLSIGKDKNGDIRLGLESDDDLSHARVSGTYLVTGRIKRVEVGVIWIDSTELAQPSSDNALATDKRYLVRRETAADVHQAAKSMSPRELNERYIGHWVPEPGWAVEVLRVPDSVSDHWDVALEELDTETYVRAIATSDLSDTHAMDVYYVTGRIGQVDVLGVRLDDATLTRMSDSPSTTPQKKP
jgi:hypothetical protein